MHCRQRVHHAPLLHCVLINLTPTLAGAQKVAASSHEHWAQGSRDHSPLLTACFTVSERRGNTQE
eukprot:CAMPEP_0119332800 /NCGR_PEP_ID=MMETSP1333-20130426/83644_1 /TAXON_ID=418940 /ORGANISM="Scyphosphaera apsteinii, Strain RCC1455" /LENGTH=64 /DNA_ID=CAMNT_0007342705 /DNA_START=75 /DNA_END=269 /DNA_ORIENTATION=-